MCATVGRVYRYQACCRRCRCRRGWGEFIRAMRKLALGFLPLCVVNYPNFAGNPLTRAVKLRRARIKMLTLGGAVSTELALQLFAEMLKTGLLVCAPILGMTLVTGVVVSVLQVVTQIQDATLAFIPKMVVFVIGALLLGPWMLRKLTGFALAVLAHASAIH